MYAIIFKDSKEILTNDTIKKYWPNYGANGLHGWRPPKKTYDTIGKAKSGFAHLPDGLKPLLAIATFVFEEIVIDGDVLHEDQKERKGKKEVKKQELRLKRKRDQLQRDQEKINKQLKELDK